MICGNHGTSQDREGHDDRNDPEYGEPLLTAPTAQGQFMFLGDLNFKNLRHNLFFLAELTRIYDKICF